MDLDPQNNQFILHQADKALLGVDSDTVPLDQASGLVAAAEAVIEREEARDLTLYGDRQRQSEYAAKMRKTISAKKILRLVSQFGEFPTLDFDQFFDE